MTAPVLEHHDPAALLLDVNIRTDMALDPSFVASIREEGVLVPLVGVRTADGAVRVRYGHRRALAAVEAGHPTVPVCVVADEDNATPGQVDRILGQYAENTHRAPLTAGDAAGVVTQLLDLGLTTGQVQRKTRMRSGDVTAAQRVAKSQLAAKTASEYGLTIDQAAAIAEFEDTPGLVSDLVSAAADGPGRFDHTLQRARDFAAERAALDAERAKLEAGGVTIIDDYPKWDQRLDQLAGPNGKELGKRSHAKCPGHAAHLVARWPYGPGGAQNVTVHITWLCTDPKAHGHKKLRPAGEPAPPAEDRSEVVAGNKAWRSATAVRRTWLTSFLARKSLPAGALRFALTEFARADAGLVRAMETWNGRHKTARELLGIADAEDAGWSGPNEVLDAMTKAGETRAQVIALAIVLGAYEEGTGNVQTWRRPAGETTARRYLQALAGWGYELSEIETTVTEAGETDG